MNYTIDENIPPVDSFPKSDKLYVVWAYGAVIKNTHYITKAPLVTILLRQIIDIEKQILNDNPYIIKISIAQLDIVRYMSIWNKQRRLNQYFTNIFYCWNKEIQFKRKNYYKEDINFTCDFNINKPESIKFIDKKVNSKYSYFPLYEYNLGKFFNAQLKKYFINATFTKLVAQDNIIVLIPSLEFLTSTYVPHEQTIRRRLFQDSLDNILSKYIIDSKIINNEYHITTKKPKSKSNLSFLAYAKYNKITKQRLSYLRTSLISSEFDDKYPIVLPYNPSSINLKADGVWLDNKKTFFIFRINEYTLPTEFKVDGQSYKTKYINPNISKPQNNIDNDKGEDNSDDEEFDNNKHVINMSNIPITTKSKPGNKNPTKRIKSAVSISNEEECNVHLKVNIIKKDKKLIQVKSNKNGKEKNKLDNGNEPIEKINGISSDEPSSSKDSQKTAKIQIVNDKRKNKYSIFKFIINSLLEIKDNKKNLSLNKNKTVFIKEIIFIDKNANEQIEKPATDFLMYDNHDSNWSKKRQLIDDKYHDIDSRKYMLLKLTLSNDTFAYLFEIDRIYHYERFSGLIFNINTDNKIITKNILSTFLNRCIIKNKGRFKYDDLVKINYASYKHFTKNMKKTLVRLYGNNLFLK